MRWTTATSFARAAATGVHYLNPTAMLIVLQCDGSKTAQQIAGFLQQLHGRFLPAIRVACVPNAVGLPAPLDPTPAGSPFTLLFVGTMGYLPNRDAAVLLATEVLPAVRRRCGAPIRLILAGGGAVALRRQPRGAGATARRRRHPDQGARSHGACAPGGRNPLGSGWARGRGRGASAAGRGRRGPCRGVLPDPGHTRAGCCPAARGRALVACRYARSLVTRRIAQLLPRA